MKKVIKTFLKDRKIDGHGFIEEGCRIDAWKVRGFFSIGAFTSIERGGAIKNALIGRFSRIGADVKIGAFLGENHNLSNSGFAYAERTLQSEEYIELAQYE